MKPQGISPGGAGREIPQGQRNATMSHFAGRVVKRYGATERAHEIFMEEAAKCNPPLEDAELAMIWQSACRFAEKVQGQEGYVAPDAYNDEFGRESLKPGDYSDIGQAKVLTREYGVELRYTAATDYLRFCGQYWVESKQQAVGAAEEFLDLQLADAKDTKIVSELGNMSLVELLLQGKTTTPVDLIKDLPGDDAAKAVTIDNNLQQEIVRKMSSNPVYYGNLSDMLQEIIMRRKIDALSYKEYLRQVVEIAEAIVHPEKNMDYPAEVRGTAARRAIYDYLEEGYRTDLVVGLDKAIMDAVRPGWKGNQPKERKIQEAIYNELLSNDFDEKIAFMMVDHIFDIVKKQEEYDA